MAATTKDKPGAARCDEVSALEAEMFDRLMASAAGLPRVCVSKKCRRRKRCLGPDLVCLRHHRGLARARFESALAKLGWPNRREDGSPLSTVIPGEQRRSRSETRDPE